MKSRKITTIEQIEACLTYMIEGEHYKRAAFRAGLGQSVAFALRQKYLKAIWVRNNTPLEMPKKESNLILRRRAERATKLIQSLRRGLKHSGVP